MKRVKLDGKSSKKVTGASWAKPWQKRCPKCQAVVHVRKKTCDCGHPLIAATSPDRLLH